MQGALPVAVLLDQAALHIANFPLKFALGGFAYVNIAMFDKSVGVANAYWNVISTLSAFVLGGELWGAGASKWAGVAFVVVGLYLLNGGGDNLLFFNL